MTPEAIAALRIHNRQLAKEVNHLESRLAQALAEAAAWKAELGRTGKSATVPRDANDHATQHLGRQLAAAHRQLSHHPSSTDPLGAVRRITPREREQLSTEPKPSTAPTRIAYTERCQQVQQLLAQQPTISSAEVAQSLQVHVGYAAQLLSRMVADGLLTPNGPLRGRTYSRKATA